MKNKILLSFCLLILHSALKAQSFPAAIVEDFGIQDVLLKDGETFYSSTTRITKIDQDDNKVVIDNRGLSGACREGEFYDQPNGWIFLGWRYVDVDVGLPILLIRQYADEILTNHSLSFIDNLNELAGEFQAATFQSMDSIYILNGSWHDFQILTVNTEKEIIESAELDLFDLHDLILLENNLNLIVAKQALYTFESNEIQYQLSFDHEIMDVKHYSNNRIEVLTQENIYWLDHSLNIMKTIPLPQNSRNSVAIYTSNEITHLVELENDQSFITALNNEGNVLSEFTEIPNLEYENLKIFDKKFAIWGGNGCGLSDNILKLDIDGVDFEIPTVDIAIDELIISHDSTTTDSVFTGEDYHYYTKDHFSWEMTVVNNSTTTIDQYDVYSTPIDFGAPSFIQFTEEESLLSNESRIHNGSFSLTRFNSYEIGFPTWIGADKLDSNCSDNRVVNLLETTSVIEKETTDIVLYPNPTSNQIWVDYANIFSYKVFDTNGILMLSKKKTDQNKINLQYLPPGMYYIELQSSDFNLMKKIVKF